MKKDPRLERAGVDEKNDFCVYFHKKKNTNEIFYVGKGRQWRQNQKSNRNKHWHNVVNKYGFDVCIVADNLTNKKSLLVGTVFNFRNRTKLFSKLHTRWRRV